MKFMSVKRTVGKMIVDEMNRTRCSSYVFPDEIHNEDAHYSRLAIEFFQEKMNVKYHFVLIILN